MTETATFSVPTKNKTPEEERMERCRSERCPPCLPRESLIFDHEAGGREVHGNSKAVWATPNATFPSGNSQPYYRIIKGE